MTLRLAGIVTITVAAAMALGPEPCLAQLTSPLAQYPGFGHQRASDQAALVRQTVARERAIAECMQRQGLQYTQKPPLINPPAGERAKARPAVDPNRRIVEALPPDQRTRYNLALFGVPDPNDEQNLWDPRSETGGGCWGDAMRAVPSVFAARSRLSAEYTEMRRSVAADPRVRAAQARWVECMTSRGHTGYQSPEQILAARDRAAVQRAPAAQMEAHARALVVDPECRTAAELDGTVATVRSEKEAGFVNAHRAVLEAHRERQRTQVLPPE